MSIAAKAAVAAAAGQGSGVLVDFLLLLVVVAALALVALPPLRAVRDDRDYAAEERRWLEGGRFPEEVERVYRNTRLVLTDGTRLRELGYEVVERRRVRGAWGRLIAIRWRATDPPAKPAEIPGDVKGGSAP